MKSILKLGLLLGLLVWLCACGGGQSAAEPEIDVDLSKASNVVTYAEVYKMLMNTDDYVGKTVRLKGAYLASFSEERQAYNHNLVIADASACCEVSINFVWDNDEHTYPDEYPEDMAEVEVTGVFQVHERGGYKQGYLEAGELAF